MRSVVLFIMVLISFHLLAQTQAGEEKWGVVMTHPAMTSVTVKANIPYKYGALDLYLPPGLSSNEKRPVVIFLPETGKNKSMEIYKTWPQLMVAYGIIGIVADIDPPKYKESVSWIFDFITTESASQRSDTINICVFSASPVADDVIASFVKQSSFPAW